MEEKVKEMGKLFLKTPRQLFALGMQRVWFATGRELWFSMPPSIILEPTNACNLRCLGCRKKSAIKEDIGFMKLDAVKGLLGQTARQLSSVLLNGFGEPLMHPQFPEFLSLFHAKAPRVKIVFFTNGLLLTDKIISSVIKNQVHEIIVSFDSATSETYRKIRGNDLSVVLENIRHLNEAKVRFKRSLPRVKASFTIMEENRGEIEGFFELLRSLGIEPGLIEAVNAKWGYVGELPGCAELGKAREICRVFFPGAELKQVFPSLYKADNPVCALPFVPYVAWNGDLKVCCYMPLAADYPLGNVFESSFRKVWFNKKSRYVRSQLLQNRTLPFCSDCLRGAQTVKTISYS